MFMLVVYLYPPVLHWLVLICISIPMLGRPLLNLGLYLFHHHNLLNAFNLDIMKLRKFLCLVEDCYHPDNCYHNCIHASDVAQALHCLISEPMVRRN